MELLKITYEEPVSVRLVICGEKKYKRLLDVVDTYLVFNVGKKHDGVSLILIERAILGLEFFETLENVSYFISKQFTKLL